MSGIRVYEGSGGLAFNSIGTLAVNALVRAPSVGGLLVSAYNEVVPTLPAGVTPVSPANAVLQFSSQLTGAVLKPNTDSTVANTVVSGYTGDTTTKSFSGQTLGHMPIVPGTVVVTPVTTGPVLNDTGGQGILYSLVTGNVCGSINYFTGALTLAYSSADVAPGTGTIKCGYQYSTLIVPGARVNYLITSILNGDSLVVMGAADSTVGCFMNVSAAATWAP